MIETLIMIYIAICASMIVFDCIFMLIMNIRAGKGKGKVKKIRESLADQLETISEKKELPEKYLGKLMKNLKHPVRLHRFDDALTILTQSIEDGRFALPHAPKGEDDVPLPLPKEEGKRYLAKYLRIIAPSLIAIAKDYRGQDAIVHTYYVLFLRKHGLLQYANTSEIAAHLKDFLEEGDIHVCEHVLQAIYTIGDPVLTADALKIADNRDIFIHPKIISDGLLAYKGDQYALQTLLLDKLSEFSVDMQVNILNYLRFASGKHCLRILDLLLGEDTDDEVKFSCIRYFGKYQYGKAYFVLADFAKNDKGLKKEFCLVSLTALRNYPGEDTLALLRENLHSPNWYIRYNAAESLNALGVDYGEFVDIFDGQDRFSREILQFQFDRRYVKDKEEIYI
ncbi:MAG: hypothetical protein IJ489_11860 [Clostridia bacterium]|nr:hypothetical protein [Clostridia bacterium]